MSDGGARGLGDAVEMCGRRKGRGMSRRWGARTSGARSHGMMR